MVDTPAVLLKVVCDNAYDKNLTSCSHSVWDVIKSIVNPQEPHRQANAMIDHLSANWSEVSLDEGYELAQAGAVVVGGLKATDHGHVVVIYPGDKIDNGGYEYYDANLKQMRMLPRRAKYPRCMSTSLGRGWPGTMSKGEKTVWDPWGTNAKFANVKFWTPKS